MDVALVAQSKNPGPLSDDALLIDELRRSGVDAGLVTWVDPDLDWDRVRLGLVRSHPRGVAGFARLDKWVRDVGERTRVENPPQIVGWRSRRDAIPSLATRGVRLATAAFPGTDAESTSLIYIDGHFTHAVRRAAVTSASTLPSARVPAAPSLNGTSSSPQVDEEAELVTASTAELLVADHALDALDVKLLFARVDLFTSRRGEIAVSDLRLVDPDLFLRLHREAVGRFARGVTRRLRISPLWLNHSRLRGADDGS